MKFRITLLPILAGFLLAALFAYLLYENDSVNKIPGSAPLSTVTPEPTQIQKTAQDIFPYETPDLSAQDSYRIVLVGDSMVRVLGANAETLRQRLLGHYPESAFVNYNYGHSSTNIESLPQRLHETTQFSDESFPPILDQDFELIIIGSFAYNPLSEMELKQGLERHNQILDQAIVDIVNKNPKAVVALMTPIAPSRSLYAWQSRQLTDIERQAWADERIAYIKNHIDYAKSRNLPLINVYQKSLNQSGEANLIYIDRHDYIHPSERGIGLMAQTIADYIYENRIFPVKDNL